jgi:hypothetical protein
VFLGSEKGQAHLSPCELTPASVSGRIFFSVRRAMSPGSERSAMAVIAVDDVQPRAQAALTSSPFYELRELQVELRENTLQISGSVSSFYHKQLAQEVVRSVCTDVAIVNSISVEFESDAE